MTRSASPLTTAAPFGAPPPAGAGERGVSRDRATSPSLPPAVARGVLAVVLLEPRGGLLRLLRGERLVGAPVRPAVGPAVPVGEDRRAAEPDAVVHHGREPRIARPLQDTATKRDVGLLPVLARSAAPVGDVVGEATVAPEAAVADLAVGEEAAAVAVEGADRLSSAGAEERERHEREEDPHAPEESTRRGVRHGGTSTAR